VWRLTTEKRRTAADTDTLHPNCQMSFARLFIPCAVWVCVGAWVGGSRWLPVVQTGRVGSPFGLLMSGARGKTQCFLPSEHGPAWVALTGLIGRIRGVAQQDGTRSNRYFAGGSPAVSSVAGGLDCLVLVAPRWVAWLALAHRPSSRARTPQLPPQAATDGEHSLRGFCTAWFLPARDLAQ
jgi:hypothetical protein